MEMSSGNRGGDTAQPFEPSSPPVAVPLRTMLFSFDGRIGRRQFVSAMVVVLSLTLLLDALLLVGLGVLPNWVEGILAVSVLVVDVLLIWSALALEVKRLHDLGRRGWWLLVTFIPLLGLILLPYLWLIQGRSNRSG